MKKDNVIVDKSFELAVRIVNLYKFLCNEKKEFVISKQLLRSGTSIGANVREAVAGISKADFRNKISIAHKEACETEYWLELLIETEYLSETEFKSIFEEVVEVNKILAKILISSKTIQ
jgi:four helix bundle protein